MHVTVQSFCQSKVLLKLYYYNKWQREEFWKQHPFCNIIIYSSYGYNFVVWILIWIINWDLVFVSFNCIKIGHEGCTFIIQLILHSNSSNTFLFNFLLGFKLIYSFNEYFMCSNWLFFFTCSSLMDLKCTSQLASFISMFFSIYFLKKKSLGSKV